MSKHNATKRALMLSLLSMVLCVSMLVGSTFAWFTDTATTGVNTIQAGTLDVVLEMYDPTAQDADEDGWVNAEGKTLQFKVNGKLPDEGTKIYWEPGCTYELPALKITNKGNLALKYKVLITGIGGDVGLNKVIDWTITNDGTPDEAGNYRLAAATLATDAGAAYDYDILTIKGHMQETAGNDYMGKSIDGISVTVYATQVDSEYDSNGNEYDKDAEYPNVLAADASTFIDGTTFINGYLQKDAHVILTDDVELNSSITLATEGTTLSLDLNGHTLSLKQIYVPNAATVEISDSTGTGAIKFTSQNGIQTNCEGANVVLNGGTLYASSTYTIYSFTEDKTGTAVMLSKGSSFVMNGGKIVADNDRSDVPAGSIAVRMFGSNSTFTMNGGEIVKTVGTLAAIQASGDGNTTGTKIEINGGSIKSNTVAIYHPQSGSLTVNDGYIEGETAIYAKSGTLTFAGGEMHATAATANEYKYDGNVCYATGDAVVIDACGYPGGNPVVTVTGGTYTVTAAGAHGFAHYKYNGNAATITNTSGIEIFEK